MCSSSGANSLEVTTLDATSSFVWVLIVVKIQTNKRRNVSLPVDLILQLLRIG